MNFDGFLVGFDGFGMHFDGFLLDLERNFKNYGCIFLHFLPPQFLKSASFLRLFLQIVRSTFAKMKERIFMENERICSHSLPMLFSFSD